MEGKTHKIDKDFVLSDDTVNEYGFILKTDGWQGDVFKKLPIGYFNHTNKDDGALVKWDEIRVVDNKILAKPVINMSHPRAQRTIAEVESGFIGGASVAGLKILDTAIQTDPNTGKKVLVVTKWANKQADLVTLPGNRGVINAAPQLFDANDNEIQLSDLLNDENHTIMDTTIPSVVLEALSLSDSATQTEAVQAINALVEKANKAELELTQLKDAAAEKEVNDILEQGLKDNKLTTELSDKLRVQFKGKPVELKDLVDTMPEYKSIVDGLDVEENKDSLEYKELSDKSFDELDQSNRLIECRNKFPQLFKEKYIGKFGQQKWDESPYAAKA